MSNGSLEKSNGIAAEKTADRSRTAAKQPAGLWCLFIVEMWERFSYYGMRAILMLYLTADALGMHGENGLFNPGRGWEVKPAATLYGWYTGLAYLFPIFGGLVADKLIGTHRSMLVGSLLIVLGHVTLAVSGFGDLAHNQLGLSIFMSGLALIVLGTGHFKPCVSVMVGQLYEKGDSRRDGGFTIFYMGINVGAFICPFVSGTLGEKVGWHWGFGSAAVGMILGLLAYLWGRPKYLKGIGEPPGEKGDKASLFFVGSVVLAGLFGVFFHLGGPGWLADISTSFADAVSPKLLVAFGLLLIIGGSVWFVSIQEPEDRGAVTTILCFILFNAFFWMAFEQAGSSLNLFARDNTDRIIFGWEMPASWFQSINPLLIVVLAPVFATIWLWLGKRGMNPSQGVKIGLGLLLLGAGYCFMVVAGAKSVGAEKVGMFWLTITFFLHTVGELCLSPTGLSFVTNAAPRKWVAFLMGLWFVSSFIANLGGGIVASYIERIEAGEVDLFWYGWGKFGGQGDFFFLFVISSFTAAAIILALSPFFRKLLRDKA